MKIRDVYSYYLAHWLAGGRLQLQDKISGIGIRAVYDSILTKGKVTKVWCITSIPTYIDEDSGPLNISHAIRTTMKRQYPDVTTNIMFVNESIPDMNTSNESYMRQMNRAFELKEAYSQALDAMTEVEKISRKKITDPNTGRSIVIRPEDVRRINELSDSYKYVFEHKSAGGEFVNCNIYVLATATEMKVLTYYAKSLVNLMTGMGLGFMYIKGNLSTFLKNKCPAGVDVDSGARLGGKVLLSDENLASIMPFKTAGLVGGYGVLMGLDTRSNLPFLWDFSSSTSAQVLLYLAMSGYGKTYAAFQTILSLVADGHHAMIIDIKGKEWERLSPFVTTKVIDIGGEHPRFVNTLRLTDLEVNKDNAGFFFRSAVDDTVMLLSIMTNMSESEGNEMDLDSILREAVMKLYANYAVDPRFPDTFKNTESLRYSNLLSILAELKSSSSYTEEQKHLVQMIMLRCSNFISEQGSFSIALDNEVTVSELLDSPVVVFSLNKNRETMLSVMDTVRIFMATSLIMKKMSIRKDKGKFTDIVFEELQRCDQFGKMLDFISHIVTGARSENAVVLLLLNSIATLLTSTSVINKEERRTRAIASNITHKIIGKVEESDIKVLVNEFGCRQIESELNAVADSIAHPNSFVAFMDNKLEKNTCIYRVVLPDEVSEQFVTRETREHTIGLRNEKLKSFLHGMNRELD
jgi:hypothetical protein